MEINYFFRRVHEKFPHWRSDEIIVVTNEILRDKQNIDNLKIQFQLSILHNYSKNLFVIQKKDFNEIKKIITFIKSIVDELDNPCKEMIKKTSIAIKVFIDISDEYYEFNELSKKNFAEGDRKLAFHFYRERNPKLIKLKKEIFTNEHGKLCCEACHFNFYEFYGARGKDYAEIHHNIPLSSKDFMGSTNLDDLSVLCSNCHRMIHRHNPWLTLEELKKIINKQVAA